MGNVSSQAMKDNIRLLNKQVFDSVSTIVNDNTANCQNNQVIQAYFGAIPTGTSGGQTTFTNCVPQSVFHGISSTQTGVTTCSLTSDTVTQIQNSFSAIVTSALTQVAGIQADQSADWASTAANIGIQKINTTQDVANLFSSLITNDVLNTCASTALANQNIFQVYCGIYYDEINIDQNSTVASVADCVSRNILTALASSDQVTQLVQQTDEKLSQKTLGLVAFLSQYKWIILGIAAILIVVFVIILLVLFIHPKGKSTIPAIPGVTAPASPASPSAGGSQQELVNTILKNPQLLALL